MANAVEQCHSADRGEAGAAEAKAAHAKCVRLTVAGHRAGSWSL
jgi:hypothetical protein